MSKKRVVRRKGVGITHTYHGVGKRQRPNLITRLLQKVPSWGWWLGGIAIVAGYVWFFYYFFVSPFGFRWRALYGDVSYPEGYEIHGIDISHHQGHIDWEELKDNGMIDKCPIRFVMIKATEGATQTDENFRENFYQAREYGFTRGAYHFYSVHSPAKDQAAFFIQNAALEKIKFLPQRGNVSLCRFLGQRLENEECVLLARKEVVLVTAASVVGQGGTGLLLVSTHNNQRVEEQGRTLASVHSVVPVGVESVVQTVLVLAVGCKGNDIRRHIQHQTGR